MKKYDVLIVGGGPAGLQAAMMLGRANRTVLLCDDDRPRNKPAKAMHYFPSRDGVKPEDFRAAFHQDIARYPHIEFERVTVEGIEKTDEGFRIDLSGRYAFSRKVILATGVSDDLPPYAGIKELYGRTVFHCPYCHGYEFRDKALAISGNGESAFIQASLLHALTNDLIVFTDGPSELTEEQVDTLRRHDIRVYESKITRLHAKGDQLTAIELEDGQIIPREGLLLKPSLTSKSQLADDLRCLKDDVCAYKVDEDNRTNIPGVFIAGDMTGLKQSALSSAFYGMNSGSSVALELAQEDFARR